MGISIDQMLTALVIVVYADGKSAVTVYVTQGESQATPWDCNGASSTAVIRSIPRAEGTSIQFKSCIGEYGDRDIQKCTGWKYGIF